MNSSGIYLALVLSALALLVSVVAFIYFRSYLKRRTSHERILSEIQTEINNIVRAVDETTERDISLIEEREKNLKSLLEEIDRRIKTYVREMDKRRIADEAYSALLQKKPDTSIQDNHLHAQESYQELGKNRHRLQHRETLPVAEPGQNSGTDNSKTAESKAAYPLPKFRIKNEAAPGTASPDDISAPAEPLPASPPSAPPPSINEQMRELLRAGFSPPLIASRLGISIAEVELAAALIERRGS